MVVEQFGYHKQRKGTRINGYLGHELVLVKRDISFFFYITFVALFVALCGIFRGTETNSPESMKRRDLSSRRVTNLVKVAPA